MVDKILIILLCVYKIKWDNVSSAKILPTNQKWHTIEMKSHRGINRYEILAVGIDQRQKRLT